MVKLFTDIDLDGMGCGILAKLAFGTNADVTYCSYRNLNQRVESFIENTDNDYEKMYITDLAVNNFIEKKLAKRFNEGKHVKVIDHHVTALHFNNYKWGHIKLEYDMNKKTCATSLFFDFLVEKGMVVENQALKDLVDLIRQYDTWEWDENQNITAKRLNDLFYLSDRKTFEEKILKRVIEKPDSFQLTDTESLILDIEDSKIERYIRSKNRQLTQAFIDGYCVGIVYAEQYVSELGNALNKLNPHLDMIVLLNTGGKKMGFRTIHENIDVAKFAERFGGGGHPKASGCELTKECFEKFVVNVFELPTIKPDPIHNELNVKGAEYGTVYQNRKGDIFIIKQQPEEEYVVLHNKKKIGEEFKAYEDVENYIKRNFSAWLSIDEEFLKQLSTLLSISVEDVKSNYINLINNYVDSFEREE